MFDDVGIADCVEPVYCPLTIQFRGGVIALCPQAYAASGPRRAALSVSSDATGIGFEAKYL